MKKIDILYLYEHVDRELDVACIVKIYLEQQHGLNAEIVQHPFGQLSPDLNLDGARPRVVAMPHAYYTPYLLDWPKATYVSLMWEQLFYKGNRLVKMPRGTFALKHVLHHVWGEFSSDYLQEVGVPKEHIFVNGNMAYALYGEPYRRYYTGRDELARRYGLDPAKRWIFFPENYNWAFYTEEKLRGSQAKSGLPEGEVYAMRDFCRDSLDETIRWCSQVVAKNENVEIIVRPRPFVPLDEFKTFVNRVIPEMPARMRITKDESVREWIMASDGVVSSYSTSLIEAAVAGKPVFMLEPLPIPDSIHMSWHDLAPHVQTLSDFETVCSGVSAADMRLGNWARRTMLGNGDPIRNLVRFLAQVATGDVPPPPPVARDDIPLPKRAPLPVPTPLLFEYHRAVHKYQNWRVRMTKTPVRPSPTFEKDVLSGSEIERRVNLWKPILSDSE